MHGWQWWTGKGGTTDEMYVLRHICIQCQNSNTKSQSLSVISQYPTCPFFSSSWFATGAYGYTSILPIPELKDYLLNATGKGGKVNWKANSEEMAE